MDIKKPSSALTEEGKLQRKQHGANMLNRQNDNKSCFFSQKEKDCMLAEFFTEKSYHESEILYWIHVVEGLNKELNNALEKLRYHYSQIANS